MTFPSQVSVLSANSVTDMLTTALGFCMTYSAMRIALVAMDGKATRIRVNTFSIGT